MAAFQAVLPYVSGELAVNAFGLLLCNLATWSERRQCFQEGDTDDHIHSYDGRSGHESWYAPGHWHLDATCASHASPVQFDDCYQGVSCNANNIASAQAVAASERTCSATCRPVNGPSDQLQCGWTAAAFPCSPSC
eukprot:1624916-Karenia_brevis.AAC.1